MFGFNQSLVNNNGKEKQHHHQQHPDVYVIPPILDTNHHHHHHHQQQHHQQQQQQSEHVLIFQPHQSQIHQNQHIQPINLIGNGTNQNRSEWSSIENHNNNSFVNQQTSPQTLINNYTLTHLNSSHNGLQQQQHHSTINSPTTLVHPSTIVHKPTYIRDDHVIHNHNHSTNQLGSSQNQNNHSQNNSNNNNNTMMNTTNMPSKKKRYIIDNRHLFNWAHYNKNQWHKLFTIYGEIQPPLLTILVEKGFVYSDLDNSWVYYRRNHFQLGITIQHHFIFDETAPPLINLNGNLSPIESMSLSVRGIKSPQTTSSNTSSTSSGAMGVYFSNSEEVEVELYQTNSKREKTEEKVPPPVLVTYTSTVTIPRLHFRKATSNNARKHKLPNPQQEYFRLIVKISARCQDKDYCITSLISDPLIVRTGHPSTPSNTTTPSTTSTTTTTTSGSTTPSPSHNTNGTYVISSQQQQQSTNHNLSPLLSSTTSSPTINHRTPVESYIGSSDNNLSPSIHHSSTNITNLSSPTIIPTIQSFYNNLQQQQSHIQQAQQQQQQQHQQQPQIQSNIHNNNNNLLPSSPQSSTTSPSLPSPNSTSTSPLMVYNNSNINNNNNMKPLFGFNNNVSAQTSSITSTSTTTTTTNNTPKNKSKKRTNSDLDYDLNDNDDFEQPYINNNNNSTTSTSTINNNSSINTLAPIIVTGNHPLSPNSSDQLGDSPIHSSPPSLPSPQQQSIDDNSNNNGSIPSTTSTNTTTTSTSGDNSEQVEKNGWKLNQNNGNIYHYGNVGVNSENPQEALSVDGNVFCTGFLYHTSDQRVKTNIKAVKSSDQLKNIMKVKIYDYEYKKEWAEAHGLTDYPKDRGVLAQELKQTRIPGAVKSGGDKSLTDGSVVKDFLVVNKESLFMENVGATQELNNRVDNIGMELEKLDKQKIQDLGKKVGELERKTYEEIRKNQKRKKIFIIVGVVTLLLILSLVALSVVLGIKKPEIITTSDIPVPRHLSDSCDNSDSSASNACINDSSSNDTTL
ncbi:NDT80/PhoG-like protein [Tieghemostelium lacteum]|uniref:NDT80/PhoG-like protein n=1 Tax=Tieghemostelium lacteum TaxID=361077 RepID=A0A152A7X6_TIELA|nr:NDT80/PhoG-like protein [Tieghemostelium lacteum]|eukprot:KYR02225.1 NDT80/PhoG-like protein [Tieghemostelium lacteum]